jgi:hypothetical protein
MSFLWFDVLNQAGAEASRLRAAGRDLDAVLAGTRDWLAGRGLSSAVVARDGHLLLELANGTCLDAWPADEGPPRSFDPDA